MSNKWPAWVTDVLVFVGSTLFNAAMLCAGMYVVGIMWPGAEEAWRWGFAFPVQLAYAVWGLNEVTFLLVPVLNPLIYGAFGLAAWRAVKLFRSKPAE